jgi:ribosomal protein S20
MEQKETGKIPRFTRIVLAVIALATLIFAGSAFTSSVSQFQTADTDPQEPNGMPRLFGRFPGFETRGRFGGEIDYNALLADALGITVEELQTAQEKADLAAIDLAVEKGYITEEQASLMKARAAVESYIDSTALTAQALGMTTQELESALDEGKTLNDLIEASGLDADAFHEALQAAYEEAIQQAVTDGVITQEQADLLLEQEFRGPMFGGGMPGGGRPPMGDQPRHSEQDLNQDDGT